MGVFQKSIYKRTCQLLAINAHKMAARTTRWLQERQGDAPTKGLGWTGAMPRSTTREFDEIIDKSRLILCVLNTCMDHGRRPQGRGGLRRLYLAQQGYEKGPFPQFRMRGWNGRGVFTPVINGSTASPEPWLWGVSSVEC